MRHESLRDVLEAHARWIASHAQRGSRAQLEGQQLHAAHLEGADLRWAQLRDTHWTDARLARANLAGADLRGAVLRDADLRGAVLVLAKLQGADLRGADLRGALWVREVGFNELDLPRVFLTANLTGAMLDGAEVDHSLHGTGAHGTYTEYGDLEDLAEPQPPPPIATPTPDMASSLRGHERGTLLELAKRVLAALPELSPVVPALESPTWFTGVGDGLDTYEVCALGERPGLTIHLTTSYCDSSAGPVVNGRHTTFRGVMPNGDVLVLGWSGSGGLQHRQGDPQLFARVCDHIRTSDR